MNYLERVIDAVAPAVALRRQRARMAVEALRNYDAASGGRRTQGWRRGLGDANAIGGAQLERLRFLARDLVRNNPYAVGGALGTLESEVVGWGMAPVTENEAFEKWSTSPLCSADGRSDFAGVQRMVFRSVVQDGEVLVRRRRRRPSDALPLPLQLEVLEADFLDTRKDGLLQNGRRVVQGVEFDALNRRVAYYLFREHPGSAHSFTGAGRVLSGSRRVPASEVLHVFRAARPGQVRGPSWFAAAMLRFRDFDDFEDATLMKQKAAACLALVTSDPNGDGPSVGEVDPDAPTTDALEPGAILQIAPGRDVDIINPPRTNDHPSYSRTVLQAIAVGLGVTYESLTGDYTNLPFSAARMSRIGFNSKIQTWRFGMLEPLLLDPVWSWAMEAADLVGEPVDAGGTEWTAPGLPMIEPDKEGPAIQRNIRTGISSWSEALRERGFNPKKFREEYKADMEAIDAMGAVLDSDARRTSQQGQLQNGVESPVAAPTGGGGE